MRIFKIALLLVFAASTVLGTSGSATAAVPCTPKGTFQDDNPSKPSPHVDFDYSSGWFQNTSFSEPVYGTFTYGSLQRFIQPVEVRFTLNCVDGFDFYYAKAVNRGIVEVYTNGVLIKEIDQYAPEVQWRQITPIPLPPGINNVEIRASGSKNPLSQDFYIGIDGIIPR